MNTAYILLMGGAGLLVLDLLVLRFILRRKVGHWLLIAAGLCVVAALFLLFLVPPRKAF